MEEFGRILKEQHGAFASQSDLYCGMAQATITPEQVVSVLEEQQARFGQKYLICLPCDEDLSKISWNSQGHATRKGMLQRAHVFFSSNDKTRAFALGHTHPTPEEYLLEFGTFKPCVHGSDAHTFDEMFRPALDRYTWIKADPTFKGLLQTINEPEARVHIGRTPPIALALRSRPTKILRECVLAKKTGATLSEHWFGQTLPLNPELIAIIGNKGSGKSALADILGLLGNTPRHEKFSFLSPTRFRDRKNNKAKHFEASVTWVDKTTSGPVSLDSTPSASSVETIKYIPQDYLESICNEVSAGTGSQFYIELQHVIFSHVPVEERLGFSSLDELLAHRSSETNKSVKFHIEQLRVLNEDITRLEDHLSVNNRQALSALLNERQRELDALDVERPVPPEQLSDAPGDEAAQEAAARLSDLQAREVELERSVEDLREQLSHANRRRAFAQRLRGKVAVLSDTVAASATDASPELHALGLNWNDIVSFEYRLDAVEQAIEASIHASGATSAKLDAANDEGVTAQLAIVRTEIENLTAELSQPERLAQQYRDALKNWEERRRAMVGSAEQPGTIEQIKAIIGSMPIAEQQLAERTARRKELAMAIYKLKSGLRDAYRSYYQPVQAFLQDHPIASTQQFKLSFRVAVAEQGFAESFLRLINQRRVGTFSGLDEGREAVRRAVESTDFDDATAVANFLAELQHALTHDCRNGIDGPAISVESQLASGTTKQQLYDQIYSLDYLQPIYSLEWDGKSLEQLSPGERGNLLLIFYLLIDRNDIPLVIDQPEENLDNHTVFKVLVPCVKEAKKRRQIVLVTHNPNLAIVCDAEQVVCAELRKDDGNRITYISGSIEDPTINKHIVDVLEGTRPAFDKRDAKYLA